MEIMLQGLKNPYNELIPLRIEKKNLFKTERSKKKNEGWIFIWSLREKTGTKN